MVELPACCLTVYRLLSSSSAASDRSWLTVPRTDAIMESRRAAPCKCPGINVTPGEGTASRTPTSESEGQCRGMNMPPVPGGLNNCCAVSQGDHSQPAAIVANMRPSEDPRPSASRSDLSLLLPLLCNRLLSPGLAKWRHKARQIRDLPTLTCALLL